ncbi:L protein [Chimay rhabdovirus]|uniref:RNA-directed RNA polymerase L n=1 Tax=Chimay rhabdovirus TaxID=2116536 RepID=A0A2P1GJD4_9RHAB|nr:L protein [Chimay rhabdovirus]AVM86063.1 L protein [Chimay rhabdovirus]
MNLLDPEEGLPRRTRHIANTHLDVPLRPGFLEEGADYLLGLRPTFPRKREKGSLDSLSPYVLKTKPLITDYSYLFPIFWREVQFLQPTTSCQRLFMKVLSVAWGLLISQILSLASFASNLDPPERKDLRHHGHLARLYYLRYVMEGGIRWSGELDHNPSAFYSEDWKQTSQEVAIWNNQKRIHVYASRDFFLVATARDQFLITRDMFLCLSDTISSRFLCLLAADLTDCIPTPSIPEYSLISKAFDWGDDILARFGNEGYRLIGMWEPLCLGVMQKMTPDELTDNLQFWLEMSHDFLTALPGQDISQHLAQVSCLLEETFLKSPSHLAQLYGLYRLWGHPVVNSQKGISKLKTVACTPKAIDFNRAMQVACKAKEIFALRFRKTHRHWPKMDVSKLTEGSHLRKCVENNWPVTIRHPDYSLLDWHYVKLEQNFEISEKVDLTAFISDKALSLTRPELKEAVESLRCIGFAWKRSVLYQWLSTEFEGPKEFLNRIGTQGFPEEENVVGVCPKERELKLEPRLFGLLTLSKRMYVVLTEALLAEHLLPYYEEITMMDDYLTLLKKIHRQTSDPEHTANRKNLFTVLDFEKWNSNMRKEETEELFTMFDQLFGLENVFTRSHEMFETSYLYLADGSYLPHFYTSTELREDASCWTEHYGGIEGLRQKGWTIFTVALIRLIADQHDIEISLMGQGDNQVLKCSFPASMTNQEIKERHQKFLDHLFSEFGLVGPPLKRSETWTTSNLFIYGKFPVLQGVPLPMSLKRVCRMFRLSNEGFPTLESSLASIFTNVIAATLSDHNGVIPYFCGVLEAASALVLGSSHSMIGGTPLIQEVHTSHLKVVIPDGEGGQLSAIHEMSKAQRKSVLDWSEDLLTAMLIFPRSWGGFSIQLFGDLASKGFPDPATLGCSLLKKLLPHVSIGVRRMIKNMLSPRLNPALSPLMLCKDPVSLNLFHPSSPSEVIRGLVSNMLYQADWIKNAQIRSFLNMAFSKQDQLADYLFQMRPLNPRVAHEVLEGTIYGRANKILTQLNKTNTMVRMAKHTKGQLMTDRLRRAEANYFKSVLISLWTKGEDVWTQETCSSKWTQHLRDKGWKTKITGVTVASPFEAFSCHATQRVDCDTAGHPNSDSGYVVCRFADRAHMVDAKEAKTLGGIIPYLGGRTNEKVQSRGKTEAQTSSPLLRIPLKLQTLVGWGVEEDSTFHRLLKRLVEAVSDWDPSLFIPEFSDISGSLEHRFADSSTTHGGTISILYTRPSYMYLSTDTLVKYCRGSANVNLHFQALFSSIIYFQSLMLDLSHPLPPSLFHYHEECLACISPIFERFLQLPPPPAPLSDLVPSDKDNPFCWVSGPPKLKTSKSSHYPSIDPNALGEERLRRLFSYKAGGEAFRQIRLWAREVGDENPIAKYQTSFALPWMYKCDPILLLESIAVHMTSMILRDKRDLLKETSARRTLEAVLEGVNSWPAGAFSSLAPMMSRSSLIRHMVGPPYFISPPVATPPSLRECCAALKQAVVDILVQITFHNYNPPGFSYISRVGDPSDPDCHPTSLKIAEDFLQSWRTWTKENAASLGIWSQTLVVSMKNQDLGVIEGPKDMMVKALTIISPHVTREEKSAFLVKFSHLTPILREGVDLLAKRLSEFSASHDLSTPSLPTENLDQEFTILAVLTETNLLETEPKILADHVGPVQEVLPGDDWSLIYKPGGGATIGPYKILSLMMLLKTSSFSVIASFGDGVGGFLSTLGRLFPNAQLFYNSLITPQQSLPQSLPDFVPVALVPYPDLLSRLIRLKMTLELPSDVLLEDYPSSLRMNIDHSFDLITCDAELGYENPRQRGLLLAHQMLTISHLMNCSTLIFKTFSWDIDLLERQIAIFLQRFRMVWVVRSKFSNQHNTEVYLICRFSRPGASPRNLYHQLSVGCCILRLNSQGHSEMRSILSSQSCWSASFPKENSYRSYTEALQTDWTRFSKESLLNKFVGYRRHFSTYYEVHFPETIMYHLLRTFNPVKGQQYKSRDRTRRNLLTQGALSWAWISLASWFFYGAALHRWGNPLQHIRKASLLAFRNHRGNTVLMISWACTDLLDKLVQNGAILAYYRSKEFLFGPSLKKALKVGAVLFEKKERTLAPLNWDLPAVLFRPEPKGSKTVFRSIWYPEHSSTLQAIDHLGVPFSSPSADDISCQLRSLEAPLDEDDDALEEARITARRIPEVTISFE